LHPLGLQVFLASASPPVRYPNVYGVDMPTRREFVANEKSEVRVWFSICAIPVD
jgi:amidophosphoribosyltransferase